MLALLLLNVYPRIGHVEVNTALVTWVCNHGGGSLVRAVDDHGLRGLVANVDARVGDVLLEVPLALTISDVDGSDETTPRLLGAAPRWTSQLPWNVQLALAVLERRRVDPEDPFIASWPVTPPALPIRCDAEELALASDPNVAQKAGEAFFWLDEQYWLAREAAEAAEAADVDDKLMATFPSANEFRDALELVWSRCLRLTTREHGVRRLLVPLLDIANHESLPSAMYAFGIARNGEPTIRLHAAQPLRAGEPVTITYGEHTNAHFALYYGFVPQPSPFDEIKVTISDVLAVTISDEIEVTISDEIEVTISDVLAVTPAELRGQSPLAGWEAAVEALAGHEVLNGKAPSEPFALRATAPDTALFRALELLLAGSSFGGEAAAARAIALVAAAIEEALWGGGASDRDAEEAGIRADERLLESYSRDKLSELARDTLSERGALLVRLRLSRRRLLASLRVAMHEAADALEDAADGAHEVASAALAARLAAASPSVYPQLDVLPLDELQAWESRQCDWSDDS